MDVISARSPYKTIQGGEGLAAEPADDLRRCLEECHSIPVPGGRLEYLLWESTTLLRATSG